MVYLDDPEFDEFNLSEEDMAAMKNEPVTTPTQTLLTQATPPKIQSVPMKLKSQVPPVPIPKLPCPTWLPSHTLSP